MLLREYKEALQEDSKYKITNTSLARVLNTTPQNISKRIKTNSELTTSELSKLEESFGVFFENAKDINATNSLKIRKTDISNSFRTWGTRLEKIQMINDLSEADMSKILNITEQQYEDIMCNDANPTFDLLKRIIENFDVDLNWLFKAQSISQSTNSDLINSLPEAKIKKLLKLLDD